MADNKNTTDTGNISKMDDTKTRKTLKLNPIGGKDKSVIDPLTMRNTETGPLGAMDDTRTRKTVKLTPTKNGLAIEDTSKIELKPVIDPLTIRNTETGPLGAMVDTRTRKTVKLKPLKTAGEAAPGEPEIKAVPAQAEVAPEAKSEDAPKMMQDTNTRKTLKLKAINPNEVKPTSTDGMLQETNTRKTLKLKAINPNEVKPTSTDGMLQDTNTRKTLKLKAIVPSEKNASPILAPILTPKGDSEIADDTQTRNVKVMPSKETTGLATNDLVNSDENTPADDDTIKIERPKQKADAMPMPSLGATAAAKTVNNKETVKLRPSAAMERGVAGDEAIAKASKETIKLSPPSVTKTEESPESKKDEESSPTVNLKLDENQPTKSKLTIGKTPPPKTLSNENEETEAVPEEKAGGLKLKSMAPKIEAPRATADKEKIKELKSGKKGSNQASPVYTMVAILTFALVAFSALITVSQYFDLWEKENAVGKQIVPHIKGLMKDIMK